MMLTILLILMLQLQSFSRMSLVVLTAPLGLIGVVAAFCCSMRRSASSQSSESSP